MADTGSKLSSPLSPHELVDRILQPSSRRRHTPLLNANQVHNASLKPLERLAIAVTDKVGSMGFFLIILGWTILWCGYNILASEVKSLGWPPFDPFPSFVAYLLISNVIQILLMPLIMVGQNLQGRHTETRAELDFNINQKAEQEVAVILQHLHHNTELLAHLMRHMNCQLSTEELEQLTAVIPETDSGAPTAAEPPRAA